MSASLNTHLPERIVIVRHGDRLDREQKEWAYGAPRPHDTPLSEKGKGAAFALGDYLRSARMVSPTEVVILSSPLVRCVETSHGIAEGLCAMTKDMLPQIPIYIENSLCEGAYWITQDAVRNRRLRGDLFPPLPVYYSSTHHAQHTSPLVRPAASQPFSSLGPSPKFVKTLDDKLKEEPHVTERCSLGVQGLLNCNAFSKKTVICVGHGETTSLWASCLSGTQVGENSWYTGFMEFMPQPVISTDRADGEKRNERGDGWVWLSQGQQTFDTPHLRLMAGHKQSSSVV